MTHVAELEQPLAVEPAPPVGRRAVGGRDVSLHILLLNEYFPPDTSATAKNAVLVAEALAQKHRVTVIAGRPSYDPPERHGAYFCRRESKGNLVVERVGSTAFPRFRMKKRLANYLSYVGLAAPRALLMRSDVILAMTDPPFEGIVAALVSKLARRPFVYNLRDMYPDMAVGGGIVGRGRGTEIWERLHRWALRHAALVIVLGEDMRERILAKGVQPERIRIIRDAVAPPKFTASLDHPVVREIRGDFRFVLVHAGNLGFYGAWSTLIEAARQLESDGVGLVFIGEGAMKAEVERAAGHCKNIRFLPFRPAAELPYVMAAGDMHIVTVNRGLEGVVVPSKVYNILAAGRPLLAVAIDKAEVARFAARDGCGLAADPGDPAEVVRAVRSVTRNTERLAHMAHNARKLATTFNREYELQKFAEALETVIAAPSSK